TPDTRVSAGIRGCLRHSGADSGGTETVSRKRKYRVRGACHHSTRALRGEVWRTALSGRSTSRAGTECTGDARRRQEAYGGLYPIARGNEPKRRSYHPRIL